MSNLVGQIEEIKSIFFTILVIVGQSVVGIVAFINIIKHSKELNLEKVGTDLLTGIALIILIGVIPSILQSFK